MAKIMLVDDAAFMRKVIRDTLSKNGYSDIYEAVDITILSRHRMEQKQ